MADMLVKLYALPDAGPLLERLARQSIHVRRAEPGESRTIGRWVEAHFSESLAAEVVWAIAREPISCYIAVERAAPAQSGDAYAKVPRETLIGAACFDAAGKGAYTIKVCNNGAAAAGGTTLDVYYNRSSAPSPTTAAG